MFIHMLENRISEVLSSEEPSSRDRPDRNDEIDQFPRFGIPSRIARRSIDSKSPT